MTVQTVVVILLLYILRLSTSNLIINCVVPVWKIIELIMRDAQPACVFSFIILMDFGSGKEGEEEKGQSAAPLALLLSAF